MVDGVGMNTADESDVVDAGCGVRQQFADPCATLSGTLKLKHGGRDGETGLPAGHGGDSLSPADGIREVGVEMLFEGGFVVPEVQLGGPAVHVQVDDGFGCCGKVREAGQWWVHLRRCFPGGPRAG